MPRGFLTSEYLDDDGVPWKLQVDADYATDPLRGWVTGEIPGLPPLPRLWQPRRVVGIDPTGRIIRTRVATLTAPLWTGAPQFSFRASDGAFYFATVIARQTERRI